MSDLFLNKEQEDFIQINQEESLQENLQQQEGNVLIEKEQLEEESELNTAFIMSHKHIKTEKANPPKTKAEKQLEKQAAEARYLDAIKFERSYAEARGDDSKDMAAIRSAMKDFFETEDKYKEDTKSEDEQIRDEAYSDLNEKLRTVESKCNSYLRFKISFSKAAKERTSQVKQLREQVRERQEKYPARYETQKAGNSFKRFFTERIPEGFKGIGRSIKRSFKDTFQNRSTKQFFKDAARDYIWGGVFRNAFNLIGMAVCLPIWLGAKLVTGVGKTINAISGHRVLNNVKYPKVGLPLPHLPSTWTRYHETLEAEKEREIRKKEKLDNEKEQNTTNLDYIVDDDHVEKKLNLNFLLFGPSIESNIYKKGKALAKTGIGYTNKQTRDSIIERANAEYQSAEMWRENGEDADEDENN